MQLPTRSQASWAVIDVDGRVRIPDDEITETFIRSTGAGGQSVNKVSSAVQLRFDIRHSPSLAEPVRERLERLGGSRVTQHGVLVITARAHRSQERNRQAARAALITLVRRALVAPRPRRATAPSYTSLVRRLDTKRRRAKLKQGRGPLTEE